MRFLLFLSQCILPFLVFLILTQGLLKKIAIYDCFVKGARVGMQTVFKILPTLVGLMIATGVLRASGFLDFLARTLDPLFVRLHFPSTLVPLTVLRMFSSSAATGILLDVYKKVGPDSLIGFTASLMMCCTETIFYTMSIYFMTAKIKKTRHTLCGALIATFAGILASLFLAGFFC